MLDSRSENLAVLTFVDRVWISHRLNNFVLHGVQSGVSIEDMLPALVG